MKKRTVVFAASLGGLLGVMAAACNGGGTSSPPSSNGSPVNGVYSVQLTTGTVSALPTCGPSLSGTVAFVASPPSLWRCDGHGWDAIKCTTDEAGEVAYESTTQTLWACVRKQWTRVVLPQGPQGEAGPPGPQGPQGIPGENGAPGSQVQVTQEFPGANCAAGGERIDIGVVVDGGFTIQQTAYVCNGVASAGDASAADAAAGDAGAVDAAADASTDPISLSPTSLSFEGSCGSTPSPRSFTITNISAAPVSWTASIPGGRYSVDVSASTLSAGASVTVTVSPQPIPQYPPQVGQVWVGINIQSTTASGATFSDQVSAPELIDGCIYSQLPTSHDFGGVPVGSSQTITVQSGQYACAGPNGGGVEWGLSPVGAADPAFQIGQIMHGIGDSWPVTFSPQVAGPHSETLTMTRIGAAPTCQPQSQVTFALTGTGTGGAVDAGAVPDAGPGPEAGGSDAGTPDSGGTTATGMSASGDFACAVTAGGGVVCWGLGGDGRLGNNSTTNSSVPVQVSGLASGVTAASAGNRFACAVTAGGGVMCWGYNGYGELGNNSTTNSSVPVQVSGLTSGVTDVSAGVGGSACALTAGGAVECWGYNNFGQLGNNSTTNSSVAVQVSGLTSGVTAVSAGNVFACALAAGGGVECWGYNVSGELGNNSTTNSAVPVQVSGL
jgi:hypothetical protein